MWDMKNQIMASINLQISKKKLHLAMIYKNKYFFLMGLSTCVWNNKNCIGIFKAE